MLGYTPLLQSQIPTIYRHILLPITYDYDYDKKVMAIYKEKLKPITYALEKNVVDVNGYQLYQPHNLH